MTSISRTPWSSGSGCRRKCCSTPSVPRPAVPEKFTGFPPGTRAVQLPDGQVIDTGGRYASWDRHPFLKAFGQPAREAACECEREGDVNLARVLELKNGPFLQQEDLRRPTTASASSWPGSCPMRTSSNELFLATLSRPPLPHEVKAALDVVDEGHGQTRGLGSGALGAAQYQRVLVPTLTISRLRLSNGREAATLARWNSEDLPMITMLGSTASLRRPDPPRDAQGRGPVAPGRRLQPAQPALGRGESQGRMPGRARPRASSCSTCSAGPPPRTCST